MSPRNGKLGVYFPKPIKKCIALFFTAVIHMHVHTPQYIETPYNRQKKLSKQFGVNYHLFYIREIYWLICHVIQID